MKSLFVFLAVLIVLFSLDYAFAAIAYDTYVFGWPVPHSLPGSKWAVSIAWYSCVLYLNISLISQLRSYWRDVRYLRYFGSRRSK